MLNGIRKFLIAAIGLSLTSCSAIQRKVAERRLDKAVAVLGAVESIEIIANKHGIANKKVDSFVVYKEKVLRDTVVIPVNDTIERVITKRDVEVRIKRIRDTIQVEAKCRDTSIYVERITGLEKSMDVLKYKYEQELEKQKRKQGTFYMWAIIIFLAMLAFVIIALMSLTIRR